MAHARKLLEGKRISYPCQIKKPNIESSMFYILQQQMKQRKDNKATREQQLIIACMDHDSIEREIEE
eukprot:6797215-Ditylum_brightwellii.AAC.1